MFYKWFELYSRLVPLKDAESTKSEYLFPYWQGAGMHSSFALYDNATIGFGGN